MAFDKWFEGQDRLIKFILLLIPFVGWVVEILVRCSAFLRKNSGVNLIGLILGIFVPIWGWVDIVVVILTGQLSFYE